MIGDVPDDVQVRFVAELIGSPEPVGVVRDGTVYAYLRREG